ncbi:MAG: hypothetical protein R2795_26020 [Saprospiraceae bacterium]
MGRQEKSWDLLKLLSECKDEGKKVLDINVLLGHGQNTCTTGSGGSTRGRQENQALQGQE